MFIKIFLLIWFSELYTATLDLMENALVSVRIWSVCSDRAIFNLIITGMWTELLMKYAVQMHALVSMLGCVIQ